MNKILFNDEEFRNLAKTKTTKELSVFFKVCTDTVLKQFKKLNIKPLRRIDSEGRKNMSIGKIKFYKENPDKHIWKKHDKFKSVPCEKLKEWLKSKNINFIEEYSIPESKNNYSLDITFPDKKIGIEVNGNQHYNQDGSLKEYYQKRHDYIESLGWKLYELHFSLCYKINEIENLIPTILNSEIKIQFNYNLYIKPKKSKPISIPTKNIPLGQECDMQFHHRLISKCSCNNLKSKNAKYCISCHRIKSRKVIRPEKNELYILIWESPLTVLGKKFNVSPNAIKKWCKQYGLLLPPQGHWLKSCTRDRN